MHLGDWTIESVSGGHFLADGGAMFGVVPKVLWQRKQPADELNRIRMGANCVLARDGRHTVLIDTGIGSKIGQRERDYIDLPPGDHLVDNLLALGVTPEAVDTVVLSHLHFDHAGGATHYDETGRIVPRFPRARYVVQRGEWEIATSDAPELRGVYPTENFLPLAEAGQLALIDGDVEILPGLRAQITRGHTQFHHSLFLESAGKTAVYVGDLCPMAAHMRSHWCMAYDTEMLHTRRNKTALLRQAAEGNWLLLWAHDPDLSASRIATDARSEFALVENFDRV